MRISIGWMCQCGTPIEMDCPRRNHRLVNLRCACGRLFEFTLQVGRKR